MSDRGRKGFLYYIIRYRIAVSINKWKPMKDKRAAVLEKVIPFLQADSVNIELVDVNENSVVKLQAMGACHGHPMATITLY